MGTRIKWTKEKLWELQEMYTDPNFTIQDIAEHFNTSKQAIYTVAYKNLMKRGTYAEQGCKRCSRCGRVLPVNTEYFHKKSETRGSLNGWCKKCVNEYKTPKTDRRCLTEFQKAYIIKNYSKPSVDIDAMANYLGISKKKIITFTKNARAKGIYIGYRINRKYKMKEVV